MDIFFNEEPELKILFFHRFLRYWGYIATALIYLKKRGALRSPAGLSRVSHLQVCSCTSVLAVPSPSKVCAHNRAFVFTILYTRKPIGSEHCIVRHSGFTNCSPLAMSMYK